MGKYTDECGHKPIFEALEPRLLLSGVLDEEGLIPGGIVPETATQVIKARAEYGDSHNVDGIGESLGDVPPNAMQVSGNITINTIWDAAGSPYEVTGDLRIYNNATLTIEPGVVVRAAPGVRIEVGYSSWPGHLIADGVVFEERDSGQVWDGLNCYRSDSSIQLTDSTVRGAAYGVNLPSGAVTLEDCTFTDNTWPFGQNHGTFNVIGSLTVTDNTHQAVNVGGGASGSWTTALGLPYEVTGDLIITYDATLTIEPGVVVRAAPGVRIEVGYSSWPGHLITDGVVFEERDSGQFWDGLYCHRSDSSIQLTDSTVRGAAYGVNLSSGAVTLEDCTFTDNTWPFGQDHGTFNVIGSLTVTGNTHQAINVGGGASGSWTTALGLPYEVTGDLIISNNATLTIEPGVVVRAAPGVRIEAGDSYAPGASHCRRGGRKKGSELFYLFVSQVFSFIFLLLPLYRLVFWGGLGGGWPSPV